MSSDTYQILTQTICFRFPLTSVHCVFENPIVPHSVPLNHDATFFEYVIVNDRRYYASRTIGFNKSSLVHVIIPGPIPLHACGEILEISQVKLQFRAGGELLWFGCM
jgi:hypothetical protein